MNPIILDIETAPHPCAPEFIERTDPASIKAPWNYTKPESIAAYIEQRKGQLEAEYAEKVSRASLDWNLCRIVAIGFQTDDVMLTVTCRDEDAERAAVTAFWATVMHQRILGFCTRTFDVPVLITRSRLLDVPYPSISLARYGKGDVIDLRDELTFHDARYEALMPRSLHAFCRRFGIPVDDPIDGSQIPQLVAEGRWEEVESHVRSDVQLTATLAARLGYFQAQPAEVF